MPSELYNLELEKAVELIKQKNAKLVCLQLPDGLKQYAKEIQDTLKERVPGTRVILWGGSCYGACDLPIEADRLGTDLLIQWGHSPWVY